ncbi:MAG: YIP1 family protein [Chloroflexi bacterium]|nr:YIP1 family protein [Chloroflexota bacterium]
MATAAQNVLVSRMIRAARLESQLYEEVEADTTALGQAMLVVVLSSVAAGIGIGLGTLFQGNGAAIGVALIVGVAGALLTWFIWALLTYLIGTTILKGPQTSSNMGETLRTIGFSTSPGVLRIFAFVPVVGQIILFAVSVWMLVAMVIAVRQALDFETWRAVVTTAIGFVIQLVVLVVLLAVTGTPLSA